LTPDVITREGDNLEHPQTATTVEQREPG